MWQNPLQRLVSINCDHSSHDNQTELAGNIGFSVSKDATYFRPFIKKPSWLLDNISTLLEYSVLNTSDSIMGLDLYSIDISPDSGLDTRNTPVIGVNARSLTVPSISRIFSSEGHLNENFVTLLRIAPSSKYFSETDCSQPSMLHTSRNNTLLFNTMLTTSITGKNKRSVFYPVHALVLHFVLLKCLEAVKETNQGRQTNFLNTALSRFLLLRFFHHLSG